MPRRIHMAQSLVGAIHNWSHSEWRDALTYITRDDGSHFESVAALKQAVFDMIEAGILYIPVGGPCDNFDPRKGCRGHDEPTESIVLDLRATP